MRPVSESDKNCLGSAVIYEKSLATSTTLFPGVVACLVRYPFVIVPITFCTLKYLKRWLNTSHLRNTHNRAVKWAGRLLRSGCEPDPASASARASAPPLLLGGRPVGSGLAGGRLARGPRAEQSCPSAFRGQSRCVARRQKAVVEAWQNVNKVCEPRMLPAWL